MNQPIIQAQPQIFPLQTTPIQQPMLTPLGGSTANGPESAASDNQNNQESSSGENENYIYVKSPIVGTFYRSSSPDKPAYIKIGDSIGVGDVVCIVEAMKLFNEIESEVSGKVVKIMIEDATPVEYDQVLFLVDPNG